MGGKWIEISEAGPAGPSLEGYLAAPEAGAAPGLLLLHEGARAEERMRAVADLYAEEGYIVLAPRLAPSGPEATSLALASLAALRRRLEGAAPIGVLGFASGGALACRVAAQGNVACVAAYYPEGLDASADLAGIICPLVLQYGADDPLVPEASRAAVQEAVAARPNAEFYLYPGCGPGFDAPGHPGFDKPASLMAHTRALALFRRVMGPHYDLSALWERHTALEFAARDAEATMSTMVAEPYVNHIPTMTGGVGYQDLLRFYKHHFIPRTPADTRLVPISRTIGADRVVDEFLFCFTHDIEMDWMLPGIPPTGRYVEIPMVAVVRFRGSKLYNEHIYWDQASVLVQIGLLDPKLLPVAGVETARKLVDEHSPSNTLMRRWEASGRVAAQ